MLALAAGTAVVVLAATAAVADKGSAVAQAPPRSDSPPTISGTPQEGSALTANEGRWTGQPTFAFTWLRCDRSGGACSAISGATSRTYTPARVDAGNTLRVRVRATNSDGSRNATSVPTAVIRPGQRPGRGCDANAPLQVQNLSAPERLQITPGTIIPLVVGRSTTSITVRFQVTCKGKPVQGALLYAAAVPFNQFSSVEQPTGADGSAQLTMSRQSGFPAARRQQLLVVFARARKPGENLLGGISTRRLVSFRVDLSGEQQRISWGSGPTIPPRSRNFARPERFWSRRRRLLPDDGLTRTDMAAGGAAATSGRCRLLVRLRSPQSPIGWAKVHS
jgi:hypothetical protein